MPVGVCMYECVYGVSMVTVTVCILGVTVTVGESVDVCGCISVSMVSVGCIYYGWCLCLWV
jgi:hypothetical protein